jgi:hypothetical protein
MFKKELSNKGIGRVVETLSAKCARPSKLDSRDNFT